MSRGKMKKWLSRLHRGSAGVLAIALASVGFGDSYRLLAGYLAYLDQTLSFSRTTTLEKWPPK